tara:strand:+ start:721 stop:1095 length:375 start_codon:yes stop_codon:yes gene_type:complete
MNIIFYSLILGVYIVYMLNYFKTKYSLSHPCTYFEDSFLYHPIGISSKPVSNICKFGHIMSWYLAAFIIIRSLFIYKKLYLNKVKLVSILVLVCGIILSMLNFNAVVYLIPYFIFEYYLLKYKI